MKLNGTLYIRGRTTGDSPGDYNNFRDALITDDIGSDASRKRVFTIEHSIVGCNGEGFSNLGDSGSLTWSRDYGMVDILFAVCPETRPSYFTHKTDLFADVMSRTGRGVRVLD